jgi:hypothetical protein
VTLKTSVVTEVPHTLSTFEKQMRCDVLATVNTETPLFKDVCYKAWQTGVSSSEHNDNKQCAQIYHSSAKSTGCHFIKVQIEPATAGAMRLEGKYHELQREHGLSLLLVLFL